MDRDQFENLVLGAINQIPTDLSQYLENIDVIVEDWPVQEQLAGHTISDDSLLLGLYEGIPLTERSEYGMVLPDKITLFQQAIESICVNEEEIIEQVRETVVHELAHHFGIDDTKLNELGR